ncbi:MAG TPA: hypothetical protein VFS19_06750 [Planctomycetota bacterium]|nr:hypothetical protein [Planctomycetota bacterium]
MKLIALVTAAVIGASPAFAQEDALTPAQAMELLKDARRLMDLAEELLLEESVEKAEKREKDAAQKLDEVIRKARSAAGRDPQKQDPAKSQARQPGAPAPTKYDPKRTDRPSVFKSRGDSGSWGHLPPSVRSLLLEASKEEIPPEFLEAWRTFIELIEKSAK